MTYDRSDMTNETNEGPRRLRRSRDRKIAGVAGGIADYLELDPTVVRLGFAVLALLGLGAVAVGYVVLWLVIPPPGAETDFEAGGELRAGQPSVLQSKVLLAVIAVLVVLALGGGIAWLGALSVQLLRISVPIWIIVIAGAYLLMRNRPTRAS